MPKNTQKGSNFKYGLYIDINGDGNLTDEKFIPGSRFEISYQNVAAAAITSLIFTAPYPCKLIRVIERHTAIAGQAGTMQAEKVPSGTAPGAGTNLLGTAFDLTSAANTNVIQAASASTPTLAVGDSLGIKLASGAATSYSGGTITAILEWL